MQRLLLVRHGRSAHQHDGSWLDATGAGQFEALYDAAPIRSDDAPPASLIAEAQSAEVLLASDLPRAITSVRAIAPDREPLISPLLRELPFKVPTWGPKLPLNVWDGLEFGLWTVRLLARVENHHEAQRASRAADWLEANAANPGVTIVVTHGSFRRLIAAQLEKRGWQASPARRRYHNWSVWELTSTSAARPCLPYTSTLTPTVEDAR